MRKPIAFAAVLSLVACAGAPPEPPSASDAPEAWRRAAEGEVAAHWLATFEAPQLTDLVAAAIEENHALAQQRATLGIARQRVRLAANVVSASFDVAAATQLQALLDQRLANLAQSLDVIDSGYRSGLNSALDVYLARNTLEQERANVAKQRQRRMQAVAALELLLADYPDGQLRIGEVLPEPAEPVAAGAPAELLQRRPGIQQAWLELLAADAALAVAHKNRFPSFSLSANARDTADAFGQLLNGGALA